MRILLTCRLDEGQEHRECGQERRFLINAGHPDLTVMPFNNTLGQPQAAASARPVLIDGAAALVAALEDLVVFVWVYAHAKVLNAQLIVLARRGPCYLDPAWSVKTAREGVLDSVVDQVVDGVL